MIIMLFWLFKVEFTRIDHTSFFGVCRDTQVFLPLLSTNKLLESIECAFLPIYDSIDSIFCCQKERRKEENSYSNLRKRMEETL